MIYWKDADFSQYCESSNFRRDHKFSNLVAGFDTETTAIIDHTPQYAFMYEWTFGVEDMIVYGRTWDEFRELLLNIKADLKLSSEFQLIVFDQRLKYEFQFFKDELWIDDKDFIARDSHKVLQCVANDAFAFRCSAEYSELTLDQMGAVIGIPKLKGYDYAKIRHSKTPLDLFELDYCEHDVRILLEYFKKEREKYGQVWKIPLTATRIVKNLIYHYFRQMGSVQTLRANQFRDTPQDMLMLNKLQRAYFGAFNYSDLIYDNIPIDDVFGVDFQSSYGAQMLLNKFPIKKFKPEPIPEDWRELLTEKYERKALLIRCKIKQLKNKYPRFGFLPTSKEWSFNEKRTVTSQDKILYCPEIILTLTDIDFKLMLKFYQFDVNSFEILELHSSKYAPLPNYIVATIVDLYLRKVKIKTRNKKIKQQRELTPLEEAEYTYAKTMISRIYGVFVQKPLMLKYHYNRELKKLEPLKDDNDEAIEEFVKKEYDPVLYQWGVWVTAYGRREILENFAAISLETDSRGTNKNNDAVLYSDTDSLKFVGDYYIDIILQYNENVKAKLRHFCEMNRLYGYKFEELEGIGEFEIEHYQTFKTIGLKKYCFIDDNGEFVAKLSGLSKENTFFDQFDTPEAKVAALDHEMEISEELAQNRTMTYVNRTIEDDVVDCYGTTEHVVVKSCVVLGLQRFQNRKYNVKLHKLFSDAEMKHHLQTTGLQKAIIQNIKNT